MTFEVINKDKVIMYTHNFSCIPHSSVLGLMSEAGFKFRLDGKMMSVKKIVSSLKEMGYDTDNSD